MVILPHQSSSPNMSQGSFPYQKSQWQQPNNVIEILLIVGGDTIQKAVAQLASRPYLITPVAFSFGWVGYSVSALLSSIGDGRLMPNSDAPSIVMNATTGYQRENKSWVLGRVLQDCEKRSPYQRSKYALVVTIFRVMNDLERRAGIPTLDGIWYAGCVVIVLQCLIAAIPGFLRGDWLILTVTLGGTVLALSGGALPQWRAEKWSCRRLDGSQPNKGPKRRKTVILTRGNGSRNVIVIHSNDGGLDLEDLASARHIDRSVWPVILVLTILWLALLFTVSDIKQDSWYLIAVGGLGMAQNLFAASHHRHAGALGIHLSDPEYVIPEPDGDRTEKNNKVFKVLAKTEDTMKQKYGIPRVGINLLPVFFPGGLWPREKAWCDRKEDMYEKEETLRRVQNGVQLHTRTPRRLIRSISASEAIS